MVRVIYIAWRKKPSEPRYIIAKLKRNKNGGIDFEYLQDYEKAKQEGLAYLSGFENLTPEEVERLLSYRIISKDRKDRNEYLEFWNAHKKTTTFDILAYTQGKSPTDNLEFLADFYPVKDKNFKIVTEIAGLTHLKLQAGDIKVGDILTFKQTPSEKDNDEVRLFKNNKEVGFVKKIHNRIFRGTPKLDLTVQAVNQNGFIKQVFFTIAKRR